MCLFLTRVFKPYPLLVEGDGEPVLLSHQDMDSLLTLIVRLLDHLIVLLHRHDVLLLCLHVLDGFFKLSLGCLDFGLVVLLAQVPDLLPKLVEVVYSLEHFDLVFAQLVQALHEVSSATLSWQQ